MLDLSKSVPRVAALTGVIQTDYTPGGMRRRDKIEMSGRRRAHTLSTIPSNNPG